MPNVSPIPNTAAVVDEILDIYRAKSIVDYNLNPAATKLKEIEAIAQRKVLAFKIFMVEDTGRDFRTCLVWACTTTVDCSARSGKLPRPAGL